MKIAIIGTHGIGKTTLAYMLAAKAQKKGYSVSVIQEVARMSPFPLNDDFTVDSAQWIITSQINRELNAKASKVNCLICDRSAYDPICYLDAGSHQNDSYEKIRLYAEEWLKTYDKILFVIPDGVKLSDDGFRSLDAEFQNKVHEEFQKLYINFNNDRIMQIHSSCIFKDCLDDLYNSVFE